MFTRSFTSKERAAKITKAPPKRSFRDETKRRMLEKSLNSSMERRYATPTYLSFSSYLE